MLFKTDKTTLIIKCTSLIILFGFIFSRLRYLDVPLDRDEGTYLYMGYCFFKGYIPYIDFYEIKPPGLFFIYGVFQSIFGSSLTLLHVGILLLQLGTSFIIYKISLKLYGDSNKALIASCVYFIFNMYPNFLGFAILSEHFFIFFILLSVIFLQKITSNTFKENAFIAGLSLGLAAMIRQHAIFFLPVFIIYLLMIIKKENLSWKSIFTYFITGNLVTIFLLLGYIAIRGSFNEMIYWVLTNPSEKYLLSVSWVEGKGYLYNYFKNLLLAKHWPMMILFFTGTIHSVIYFIKKQHRWEAVLTVVFFTMSFISIFPGFRFYGHYWLMVFPATALVTGNAVFYFKNKTINIIIPFFVAAMFIIQLYVNTPLYFSAKADLVYQKLYGNNPNYSLQRIVDYLNRRLKATDEIFVFGSEPQVYYETKKILKIPHVYIGFLHVPSPDSGKKQNETIHFLNNSRPEYLVHIQNPTSVNLHDISEHLLYNWIFGFESSNYTPIAMADIDDNNNPTYYFDKAASTKPLYNNYIILYKLNH